MADEKFLFRRNVEISMLGADNEKRLEVSGDQLRIAFNVTKYFGGANSQGKLVIYNLAQKNRNRFKRRGDRVFIKAGYKNLQKIYSGSILTYNSIREGTNWISTFDLLPFGSFRQKYIIRHFQPGSTFRQVVEWIADQTALEADDFKLRFAQAIPRPPIAAEPNQRSATQNIGSADQIYTKGYPAVGEPWAVLKKLMATAGLSIRNNDGVIEIGDPITAKERLNPSEGPIQIISPQTGMIGSPQLFQNQWFIVRSLLRPDIKPGNHIKLEAREIKEAEYLVYNIKYVGDTWGQAWYSEMLCGPRGSIDFPTIGWGTIAG